MENDATETKASVIKLVMSSNDECLFDASNERRISGN